MKYELTQGEQSNYEITLNVNSKDLANLEKEVLKWFQKNMDIPGFRKGNVPLDVVKDKVQDHYLKMGVYEQAIHEWLDKLVEDNEDIDFIGNIYDLNPEEDEDWLTLTFKLDEYPEVEIVNKNWETVEMDEISKDVTQKEIDKTIENLKKQNANYTEADKVTKETVNKIEVKFVDEDGDSLDTATAMVGIEDMEEFEILEDLLIDKTKDDDITNEYDEESLPPYLHYDGDEDIDEIDHIEVKIVDIQKRQLPDLDDDKVVNDIFGKGWVTNKEQLLNKIKETLKEEKTKKELVGFADNLIEKIENSLQVAIPRAMVEEEKERRIEMIEQRMGGQEAFEKYKEKIGDEKYQEMIDSLTKDAKNNLKNYFILNKYAELKWIDDIDWQRNLDAESKIYEELTGDSLDIDLEQKWHSHAHKHDHDHDHNH